MYNNIVNPLNGKTLNIQDITGQKLLGKYIYQYNSELVKSVLATMRGGSEAAATKIEVLGADTTPLDIEGTLNRFKREAGEGSEAVEAGKIINVKLLKKLYTKIGEYVTTLNKSDRVAYEEWVHNKLKQNPDIEFGDNEEDFFNDDEIEEQRISFINSLIGKKSGVKPDTEDDEPVTHILKSIEPVSGDCFGEYKIIKTLGKGAEGTVYEVEKKGAAAKYGNKKFAMKEQKIPKSFSKTEMDIELNKIGKEIKIGTLMGKNELSPKIHDSYLCESGDHVKVFIVMDIMNGGSLEEFSQINLIDAEFMQKIRDKVKKMHELKIFHTDLHAGNIFVHKKDGGVDEPYIGDFGTSEFFDGRMKFLTRREGKLYFLDNLLPDPTKLIVRTMMAIEVL
uniref:Protein kinase domain-containing protein n=1 Tax=viral metagenome TaxID=1070528 RepID=A0A6C0B5U6_9ZZZZ